VPGDGTAIELPSGQSVTLVETIWNTPGPQGLATRFRFLAPEINPETGSVDFLAAADDIAWLCQNFALSRVTDEGPIPSQIARCPLARLIPKRCSISKPSGLRTAPASGRCFDGVAISCSESGLCGGA
jgi:hypothetical protein